MTISAKPILAGLLVALALPPMAEAQQTGAPIEQSRPQIAPRNAPPQAGQADQTQRYLYGERRHDDRRARRDDDDDDYDYDDDDRGWFFFGRHGARDRDCDDRGRRSGRSSQSPAAPGSVAPPANGLFNKGAAPKAQVN